MRSAGIQQLFTITRNSILSCLLMVCIITGCKTTGSTTGNEEMVIPSKLTVAEYNTLRTLLETITHTPVRDTFLVKHYHSHDDCWSTSRYRVSPDVLGGVMRLEKWLKNFATNNPHITVLQVRQPGSGPLKYIKRNYDVKVDIRKSLLQFPMFGKQPCGIVWLVMPDGTLHQITARY
jgi:hypothetical protein